MDISTLNLAELSQLQKDVATQINARGQQDLLQAQEQVKLIAQGLNMSVADLFASMGKTKTHKLSGKSVAAKYQNPNNPDQTWTGRGRKPTWVGEAISSGATLESLAIASVR